MTYYIDYKKNKENKIFEKIRNRLFYRFSVIDIDNDKKCIYINKKYINYKAYKKMNRYLNKHNFELLNRNALVTKDIQIKKYNGKNKKVNDINDIRYVPKEKYIMKAMLYHIIRDMEKILDTDFRNECVYVSIINDKNKDILEEIIDIFKSVNIVTTRIGYMRRMEMSILKNKDALISISNNKKKALKRAKILINFDFKNDLLNEFNINRNCIIINLNNSQTILKSSFQGSIIDAIQIDFKNRYEGYIKKNKYNLEDLYSSYIQHFNYFNTISHITSDKCKILNFVGIRGIISAEEIVNNYTNSAIMLDKTRKMD